METDFMEQATTRKRKSEALSKEDRKLFSSYVKKFHTKMDCAEAIGIHRSVLDKVILSGSGAPETIEKIRLVLSNQ